MPKKFSNSHDLGRWGADFAGDFQCPRSTDPAFDDVSGPARVRKWFDATVAFCHATMESQPAFYKNAPFLGVYGRLLAREKNDAARAQRRFRLLVEEFSRGFLGVLAYAVEAGLCLQFKIFKSCVDEQIRQFQTWFRSGLEARMAMAEADPDQRITLYFTSGEGNKNRWRLELIDLLREAYFRLGERFFIVGICSPCLESSWPTEYRNGNDREINPLLDLFISMSPAERNMRLLNSHVRLPLHGVYNGQSAQLSIFHSPLRVPFVVDDFGLDLPRIQVHVSPPPGEENDPKHIAAMDQFARHWFGTSVDEALQRSFGDLLASDGGIDRDRFKESVRRRIVENREGQLARFDADGVELSPQARRTFLERPLYNGSPRNAAQTGRHGMRSFLTDAITFDTTELTEEDAVVPAGKRLNAVGDRLLVRHEVFVDLLRRGQNAFAGMLKDRRFPWKERLASISAANSFWLDEQRTRSIYRHREVIFNNY